MQTLHGNSAKYYHIYCLFKFCFKLQVLLSSQAGTVLFFYFVLQCTLYSVASLQNAISEVFTFMRHLYNCGALNG